MKNVVHAACPHDCPDACGVLITVENGRATKIQGDPSHPITRGFLCAKVAKYLGRVYSTERVLYPMRRIGPKEPASAGRNSAGEGARAIPAGPPPAFKRITWDEALDEIAARFKTIVAEFGSEAILPYSYGGTLAVLNGSSMDRRVFHPLGGAPPSRTIFLTARGGGFRALLRGELWTAPQQILHSTYIIAWGAYTH